MSNQKKNEKKQWAEQVAATFSPRENEDEPLPLSLILPTYNCADVIAGTLESIERQEYPSLELIIVDAGSTDHTLEIVNSYASLISRVYTVANYNLSDMLNRGISLSSREYLTFMLPGSFYLADTALKIFLDTARAPSCPEFIYCGTIQREVKREPRTIYLPLDVQYQAAGRRPSSIVASWFRADLFDRFGKFDPKYTVRSGFDLFCRLAKGRGEIEVEQIDRVYVDFDYGRFTYGKALRYAAETWRILSTHFGMRKALRWFLSINSLDMIKSLWARLKQTIFRA